jgi:hypothetical protein
MIRKVLFVSLLIVVCIGGTTAFADDFRLGFQSGVELLNRPDYDALKKEFDNQANIMPGLYWEVIPDNVGFGMTYLARFSRQESTLPEINNEWYLDWIGSFDFRYHFMRYFLLDPFAEAGFGCAGRVDITSYGSDALAEERNPMNLSLFGQVGGGIALRLRGLHVGAKALYRFYNQPPPATQFDEYPLKNFHFSLFGGLSF